MALYQILVPLFCLIMVVKAISLFRRGRNTTRELIGWLIVWGSIAAIAIFPDSTTVIADQLGIKSNVNAILFISMGILFYMMFRLVVAVEDLQQDVTEIVRKEALKKDKTS